MPKPTIWPNPEPVLFYSCPYSLLLYDMSYKTMTSSLFQLALLQGVSPTKILQVLLVSPSDSRLLKPPCFHFPNIKRWYM